MEQTFLMRSSLHFILGFTYNLNNEVLLFSSTRKVHLPLFITCLFYNCFNLSGISITLTVSPFVNRQGVKRFTFYTTNKRKLKSYGVATTI